MLCFKRFRDSAGAVWRSVCAYEHLVPILLLTALYIIFEIVINPIGEFTLQDDWCYARTVLTLVNEHKYELNPYMIATFFSQALWGTLFASIFGFSMTTLRFSVIVLGWAGVISAYYFFLEAKVKSSRWLSFAGALVLMTTPFYVVFSNTFMTDTPFLAVTIAASLFLVRWIKNERSSDLILGILLICIATLIRQVGLAIPAAFLAAYIFKKNFGLKAWLIGFIVCAVCLLTLLIYHHWIEAIGQKPVLYTIKQGAPLWALKVLVDPPNEKIRILLLSAVSFRALVSGIYVGLLLFPFLVLLAPSHWKAFSKTERWIGSVAALLVAAATFITFIRPGHLMPLSAPEIYNFGLGAETDITGGNTFLPKMPLLFWLVLTIIGMIGAAWLAFLIVVFTGKVFKAFFPFSLSRCEKLWIPIFSFTACVVHFIPFGLAGTFDRYSLFYIPFIIFALISFVEWEAPTVKSFRIWVSVALLLPIAYYSVVGTRDHLEGGRAKWNLLRYLMQYKGIPPSQIDGGYDFNGWYTYDPNYIKTTQMNWWWVVDDKYRISTTPSISGYEVDGVYAYQRWLPPVPTRLFVLKRIADQRTDNVSTGKTVYEF